MIMEFQDSNKRILKNTLALYTRMVVMMLINLYTSRVVLSALGVNDFGLYSIVAGLSSMFGVISNSLASATSRFLSFELGSSVQNVNKVFQSSLFLHLILALFIFLLGELLGDWMLNNLISIPNSRLAIASWVYQFSLISVCIAILTIPYNALIISHEKMNFYAILTIVDGSIKLVISLLIEYCFNEKLIAYASLLTLLQITILGVNMFFCYYRFTDIRWGVSINKDLFKRLLSFSGWNFLSQLATLSTNQGVSILLNNFFGLTVNAAKDLMFQVQQAVAKTCINFQIAVNPQITKSYAGQDVLYMHRLMMASSKFSSYLLFIFAIPVFTEISALLKLWLVEVPEHTDNFIRIMLIQAWLSVLSNPISVGIYATGKMKNYSLIISIFYLLILPISYFVLRVHAIPELVFIVYVSLELCIYLLKLFFMRKYLALNYHSYFNDVVKYISKVFIISSISCYAIRSVFDLTLFVRLSLMILIILIYIFISGLNRNEKIYTQYLLKSFLKKIKLHF